VSRDLTVRILGESKDFNRAVDGAITKTERLAGKMGGFGKGMVMGAGIGAFNLLSGAVDTAVSKIGDAVTAASDLNETTSKIGVVFGGSGAAILKWGEDAATALGMSKNQALAAAGTYGNLLVSLGLTGDKAADMSTNMVGLAADLASFNNASPEETLAAIQSGLVGETEPLRRFGINLNDAQLREKALSMGLVKTTKEVLPAAVKAQAAYALILDQSKTAQGDFARTSDGLANQQRITDAKMADLSATIGSKLLPMFLQAQTFVVSTLIPAFEDIVTKVQPIAEQVFGVLGDAIQWVATNVMPMLAEAFTWVSENIMPMLAEAVTWVSESVMPKLVAVFTWVSEKVLPPFIKTLKWAAETILPLLGAAFEWISKNVLPKVEAAMGVLGDAFVWFLENVLPPVREAITFLAENVLPVLSNAFQAVGKVVGTVFGAIGPVVKGAINFVIGAVNGIIKAINGLQIHVHMDTPVGSINFDWGGLNLPHLPYLHAGGVVPGAPGSDVLAVLQAGEQVTPANARPGLTVIVNGNIYGPSGVDELMDMIALRLKLDAV
jgi:phage-related protein